MKFDDYPVEEGITDFFCPAMVPHTDNCHPITFNELCRVIKQLHAFQERCVEEQTLEALMRLHFVGSKVERSLMHAVHHAMEVN